MAETPIQLTETGDADSPGSACNARLYGPERQKLAEEEAEINAEIQRCSSALSRAMDRRADLYRRQFDLGFKIGEARRVAAVRP